ncbi:MAG: hypothetical protein HY318_13965, partial [Armatimonadetes bacterium]|nr:hypothetical protein [Armatimonadota bacterium]
VSNVSFEKYLESEEKWQAFMRAVKEAKKAGMALWLYDERGYPSGNAGGITLRGHPEWEARGLLIADATSDGGQVSLDAPPGKLTLAAAFRGKDGVVDLNGFMDLSAKVHEGKLSCELPVARWRVMIITEDRLYEGTHASLSLADKLPYINLLRPEPTKHFLEVTHQRYAERLGSDLSKFFASTFTDEPSLMSAFLRPMPYRVLPWSSNLPLAFRKRRGYALEPVIPALIADAGSRGSRVRYDFWQTVGELVSENYFGQIQQWCRAHNLASGGHLLAEESVLDHVAFYGDFFRCARRLDAPSIDCLTSVPPEVPWHIARLISSAAELEGRTLTMCETSDFGQIYRPAGDKRPVRTVTEDEIRGTCNRLLVGGINTITSYYSFSGLATSQLQRLNLWVGRCSAMLRGGHQVTDLGVVYPVESVWPRFSPARHGATDSPTARQIQHVWQSVNSQLFAARRDFTVLDSRTLVEAKVDRGALVRGALRWRVVMLPCLDTLPMKAWNSLARFWRSGGVVVALGSLPRNSETEFPSARVQALAREMFGTGDEARVRSNSAGGVGIYLPEGTEALLPTTLDAVLERDVSVEDPRAPVRATHRVVEGHHVYFLINDSGVPWEGDVSTAGKGTGEQWDPATGAMTPLQDSKSSLKLQAYGGVLLRFSSSRTPRRMRVESGPLPGISLQPLPAVAPSFATGEFVQAQLAPEATQGAPGKPVWRAVGELTKGQVDTFLFVNFDYPQPLDLRGAQVLYVQTWTPKDQKTPANLLVILQEKSGGQYIVDTGRSLALPGHKPVFVTFSQLSPAGWAKDPNGQLDLDDIVGIRLGWGGYYGAKGERVEFSLSTPQVATLPGKGNGE